MTHEEMIWECIFWQQLANHASWMAQQSTINIFRVKYQEKAADYHAAMWAKLSKIIGVNE